MKNLKLKYLLVLVVSLALFAGCDKDDEDQGSAFVGNFVISKAMLAETLTIPIVPFNGMSSITAPIGQDITQAIQNALLSQVTCSSADKSWVELREDNSMYMSCEGANALNAGTWEEVSATELKLNMNSAAIPSSPSGFVLNVTNIVQSNNTMTGKTSVPLPKEMVAGMIAPLTLAPSSPPVYLVTFTIEFVKK
jgi:hypothetical protein